MNFLNDITVNNNITAVGTIQSANLTVTGLSTGAYTSIITENAGIFYKRDLSLSLLPSGTEGQMLYNNGGTWTAFSGVFWDDTNSRLGVGLTSGLAAKLHVRGPGTTSGTYSFIAEKSDGSDVLAVRDDGEVDITGILNVNSNGTAKMTVDSSTGLNRRVIIGATTGVDDTFIVRADDNTVTPSAARFQNLDSTSVANGIRLRFEMATTAAATVNAGAIDIIKDAVWTSTASTQDSHMRFLLSVDGTLTEAMRINSGLNVGIGTANPVSSGADGRVVHLVSPTRTEFRAATTSSATMRAGATNVGYIGTEGAHDFLLQTNLVTRATINATTGVFNFTATPTVSGSTMWHAGNDGASSTLDADLLDGQHGSYYLDSTNLTVPTSWVVSIQENNAEPFLYGTYGDAMAFRTISNLEYWDGAAWQTYSNGNMQGVLTGHIQGSSVTVTPTNKRFRFQFTAPAQYLGRGVLVVHQTWNNGAHQISSMLEYWNGTTWVTLISEATSPAGENNYHFYNRGDIHGAWDLYRVTITSADAVNSTTYTGFQLLYDYTRSGSLPNTFLPITWDWARNVTSTGTLTGSRLISTVATGTAPLTVTSTTLVSNLNADLLDGQHGSYFENRDVTAVSFTTGQLTLTRAAGNLSVSLDGRYLPLSAGTSTWLTDKLRVHSTQPGVVLTESDTVDKNRWIDVEGGTLRIMKVNDALNSWTNQLTINEDGKMISTSVISATVGTNDSAFKISASVTGTESFHKIGLWNEVTVSGTGHTYQRTGVWTTVNGSSAHTFSSLIGYASYLAAGNASSVVTSATCYLANDPNVTGTFTAFTGFATGAYASTQIDSAFGVYSAMSIVSGKTRYFLYGAGTAPSYLGGTLVLNSLLTASNGTAGAPSLTFTSDPDTGLYSVTGNTLGVTTGGALRASFLASGLEVYNLTGPQIRLSGQASNGGGLYLACVDEGDPTNEGYIAFGAEGTHASGGVSTWTARQGAAGAGSAGIVHCDNGTFVFYSNTTGLTAGSSFTPTNALQVSSGGVTVGSSINLNVTGTANLNGGASINNADPRIIFSESDGATDQKRNDFLNQASVFYGRFYNDAGSLSSNWLSVTRNAATYTAGTITLTATNISLSGALSVSSSALVTNLNADQLDGQHGSYYLDTSSGTQSKSGNVTFSGTVTLSGSTTTVSSAYTTISNELTSPSCCTQVHEGNVEKYYQCSQKMQGTAYTGNSTVFEIEVVTTAAGSYGGACGRTVWRVATRDTVTVLRYDEHGGAGNTTLRIVEDTTTATNTATRYFIGVTIGNASTYQMAYIRARHLVTDGGSRWVTMAEMATATPTTQGGSALTYSSGWVVNSGSYTLLSHTETPMNLKAGTLTTTSTISHGGTITPSANNTLNLGSVTLAYTHLYGYYYNVKATDGAGIRFWDGSTSYQIYMAAQGFSGAGRMDGTSDYNIYFRMTGGTNRGFVFQNNTTNVAQIDASGTFRAGQMYSLGSNGGYIITRRDTSATAWQWYSSAGSLQLYDHIGAADRLTWTSANALTIAAASTTFTGASGITVSGGASTLKASALGTAATYFAVFNGDPSTSGTAVVTRTATQVRSDISAATSGAITASGLTMSTARLLGRTTASTGAIEEISLANGTNCAATLSSTTLTIAISSTPTFTDCTVTGRLNLPTSQPASPVNGSCYWDSSTNKFWVYSSTYGWKSVTLT